jgi:hypothetical protein
LFGNGLGDGVESGAGASGEDNAFHNLGFLLKKKQNEFYFDFYISFFGCEKVLCTAFIPLGFTFLLSLHLFYPAFVPPKAGQKLPAIPKCPPTCCFIAKII